MGTGSSTGRDSELAAQIEPFDSFWGGPADVEMGYAPLAQFYRANYLAHVPAQRDARILVVSCGPGYFTELLVRNGWHSVVGIDSDAAKVEWARNRGLDCRVERAFPFLRQNASPFDLIFCEQELNHLTKAEMRVFLSLCRTSLRPGGVLIVHGLNGANPITGAEALAQNYDHFNTFTEYSLRQILEGCGLADVRVRPLALYVFYRNPLNYLGLAVTTLLEWGFRLCFRLYGKANRLFSKKIFAVCRRPDS